MQGIEKSGDKPKSLLIVLLLMMGVLIFILINRESNTPSESYIENSPFFLEKNYRFSIMMNRELLTEEVLKFKNLNLHSNEALRVHRCTNQACSRASTAALWNGEEVSAAEEYSYTTPKTAEHYIWLEDLNGPEDQRAIGVKEALVEGDLVTVTYLSGSRVVISLDNLDLHQGPPTPNSLIVRVTQFFSRLTNRFFHTDSVKEMGFTETATGSETAENLVRNAGFEHNLNYWHSKYDLEPFTYISEDGHTQNGALAVQTNPPENPIKNRFYQAEISQCVPLKDGLRYRFAASFKPQGDYLSQHTNRVNLIWYQSEDCSIHGEFSRYLEPEPGMDGWQKLAHTVTRALNAKAAKIEITQNKLFANNTPALWDDIELVATEQLSMPDVPDTSPYTLPAGVNYIKNSEFSENLKHWRFSGDTTWAANIGAASKGAARLAIFSDRGGYGAHSFSQCITFGVPRVFSFGAKVKIDPASTFEGGGIFRLNWYENPGCSGRSAAGFKEDRVEYIEGWQSIGVNEITAPKNSKSASLYFTRGISDSGNFAYFVDDVFFKAIE